MRLLLSISLLFASIIVGCQPRGQAHKESKQIFSVTSPPNVEPYSLNGTWGLTNYFDTILAHREIARFYMQEPAQFGILAQIQADTLFYYGSLHQPVYRIQSKSDSLLGIIGNSRNTFLLIQAPPYLKLVTKTGSDSSVFLYRKRNDLSYFTKENLDFWGIGRNVTDYFNANLLAGSYGLKGQSRKVTFEPNGTISGLPAYDKFEVDNYFGTHHPFYNKDVVRLHKTDSSGWKWYNWVFSGDDLTLTEFVPELMEEGGEYRGREDTVHSVSDFYILGDEVIRLKKID